MITGFAGFIGFHAAREFLRRGWEVVGIDNFNDYYSVKLKRDRAAVLEALPGFSARELDICDLDGLRGAFAAEAPDVVLNLAAQPGVRYCIDHPFVYQKTNIEGFLNVLECCRHAANVPKLVLANSLGVEPKMEMLPMQPDDVYATYASIEKLNKAVGYEPKTTIREGIPVFAQWYKDYHGL